MGIGYGLKSLFSFIKLYLAYYDLTFKNIYILVTTKELIQLNLQFKRKEKPLPQELNHLKHLFSHTALENGANLARKVDRFN